MLKLTLKHLKSYKFNKKWWIIRLEKGANKYFKFGVIMYSSIPHFLFRILFLAFLYNLKLINNRASEFFTIFIIWESTKKDGLKTTRNLFD